MLKEVWNRSKLAENPPVSSMYRKHMKNHLSGHIGHNNIFWSLARPAFRDVVTLPALLHTSQGKKAILNRHHPTSSLVQSLRNVQLSPRANTLGNCSRNSQRASGRSLLVNQLSTTRKYGKHLPRFMVLSLNSLLQETKVKYIIHNALFLIKRPLLLW